MENSGKDFGDLKNVLSGTTCVMVSENLKAPAKAIKTFRDKAQLPVLKGAWLDNNVFVGDATLEDIINLKSKEELIGDVIAMLQTPARNVISALQSNAGHKIAGLVKAVSESKS
jgi:large subunit ribosomal protein L10